MMRLRIAALAVVLFCAVAHADERILEFDADIEIHPDGALVVTEVLRVRAEGNAIRRGIFRDFPTRYRDRVGNRYRVDFEFLGAERNGRPEDWHTETRSNGLRIYLGSAQRLLDPGVHEYRLRYRTGRQLGHFEEHDELYWNVTGTGWAFPIDRARARIRLPEAVPEADLRLAYYTGPQGAMGQDAHVRVAAPGQIAFETTAPLSPREGLTIAVGWPKGLVEEPSRIERAGRFLRDNLGVLVLLLGFAGTLAWYLWAWNRWGRDPRKGTIIPRFEPPAGLSPAACRYVLDMGLSQAAFTAAVVSLGVKGHLTIEDTDDGFTLRARKALYTGTPSPGERAVLDALLPDGRYVELDNSNHSAFRSARSGLEKALASEYKGRLFRLNVRFAVPPIVLSLLALAVSIPLRAGPFGWVPYVIAILAVHGLFIFLLRAPTPAGRRIMDEIEGFRMYLDTAEADRLQRMRSPKLTPEVFEQFLPYAFALGVENHWCERFEREFPQPPGEDGRYQPSWYSGGWSRHSALQRVGSGLGAGLSSAIASAATPPGSSSGSGGGGFSGGGGGGGGGGGW